jgi:hypothetical protein
MVTPVCLSLIDAGTGEVIEREGRVRGTAYGRYGRGTKFKGRETQFVRIQTEVGAPLSYRMKTEMPYVAASNPPQ